eukprot:scaffold131340_cov19-Prasinocladus_malaysianus.AAC.1
MPAILCIDFSLRFASNCNGLGLHHYDTNVIGIRSFKAMIYRLYLQGNATPPEMVVTRPHASGFDINMFA